MAGASGLCQMSAGSRDVAAHLTQVEADGRRAHLAAGLSYVDEAGQPDVMRGEETEIFGIADAGGRNIVLPGSHSKWRRSTAIASSPSRPSSPANCSPPCETTRSPEPSPGLRPPRVRAKHSRSAFAAAPRRGPARKVGRNRPPVWRAIAAAHGRPCRGRCRRIPLRPLGRWRDRRGAAALSGEAPHVAGAEALVERYLAAFEALGVPARAAPMRAAARGLFRIARDGGLL